MITVKVTQLFQKAAELLKDGFSLVNIDMLQPDDELPAALSFEAVEDDCYVDYDLVSSYDSEDASEPIELDETSPLPIVFNMNDLELISLAFHEAIASYKSKLDKTSLSANDRSRIAQQLKACQSFINPLDSAMSSIKSGKF